ncbi:hypothetical protein AYK25_01460 [Thermoplasmatales archaeon SM1-50]|nr:MAG: hypothetical protein AYK25_01460 [Thermoplasmatales archaeon SM1-50]
MSKKQVIFCGYRCDLCPAFVKNKNRFIDRTTLRAGWNTFFGFDIPEERIICVGCVKKGDHLDTGCTVQPCALSKPLQNCSLLAFLNPVILPYCMRIYLMRLKRHIVGRF